MSSTYTQRLTPTVTTTLVRPTHRDRRNEFRVDLPMPVTIRRPNNSPNYRKVVETQNVSRNGARLILDIPIELGAELKLYAFNDRFTATVVVRNVKKQRDGRWAIGIQLVEKCGKWIIN